MEIERCVFTALCLGLHILYATPHVDFTHRNKLHDPLECLCWNRLVCWLVLNRRIPLNVRAYIVIRMVRNSSWKWHSGLHRFFSLILQGGINWYCFIQAVIPFTTTTLRPASAASEKQQAVFISPRPFGPTYTLCTSMSVHIHICLNGVWSKMQCHISQSKEMLCHGSGL